MHNKRGDLSKSKKFFIEDITLTCSFPIIVEKGGWWDLNSQNSSFSDPKTFLLVEEKPSSCLVMLGYNRAESKYNFPETKGKHPLGISCISN